MFEIQKFLKKSVKGLVSVDEQVKFLEEYSPDKVTAKQLKIFAKFMLKHMTRRLKMPDAIDVCGTGGSGLNRINTSTISAFILAAFGVGVAKHGNKAASGRFGSFDLLEALGVKIEGVDVEKKYRDTGLAFIYARDFHPVMKHFVEARKKIGKPTVFNLLGPLLNPARVEKQIIGCGFKKQMKLIAETCKLLGKKHVMVVHGSDGLDEVTLTGKTDVVELYKGDVREYSIGPEDFGISRCDFKEIAGGTAVKNMKIALDILSERCRSRHADLVYVNTALALKLSGAVDSLEKGYRIARGVIGLRQLEKYKGNIMAEIAASKLLARSERDFKKAISERGVSLIAEIKKASPSEGEIVRGKFEPGKIAQIYEGEGAKAISVLTDEEYFDGSFDYLREAKEATFDVPILCKDFIMHEYQIFKAREAGADAVLLIVSILTPAQIKKFLKVAQSLGMDCLVEVHDEAELDIALKAGAEIIGINNRNLQNFSVDLGVTNRLVKKIPAGKIIVSESGINSGEDVKRLDKRVNAILVGTAIMKSRNMKKKIHELT